jgi:hypothetical protein
VRFLEEHVKQYLVLSTITGIAHFVVELGVLLRYICARDALYEFHFAEAVFFGILAKIVLYDGSWRTDDVNVY